ncbi:Molybdate-anion transporter [Linum perenne]
MEIFYFLVFGGLSAVVALLEFSKNNKDRVNTSLVFNSFKNNYLLVYSLMMAGDWLQGPYVYYLYSQYGYGKGDIGQLFIAGFGSSMLFGTIVGSLADQQGRKRACITYCITYILSCITKHSPHYKVLMLGRILGGIATSLLFSAFESWLVAEHFKRGFEAQWLSVTFSKAIFLGNGLVAIIAGLFGNVLVDALALGPVAPFDAAACFLAIGMAVILSSWSENYGDPSENKGLMSQFKAAAIAIASDEKIALVGAIQSLFEGSMYTFFLVVPTGVRGGSISLSGCIQLMGFCVFEGCVGTFWPSIMKMRSQYIPEEARSTIMNFFRIPLNIFVCVVLYNVSFFQSLIGICQL